MSWIDVRKSDLRHQDRRRAASRPAIRGESRTCSIAMRQCQLNQQQTKSDRIDFERLRRAPRRSCAGYASPNLL